MRVFFLTIALMALAMPAFANCGATHQASSSDSTVATNPPPAPAPDTDSGG